MTQTSPSRSPWTTRVAEDSHYAYLCSAHDGDLALVFGINNARLIAAAPDMLAALFLFADLPTDTPPPGILPSAWRASLAAAQVAIAKAGGR